MLVAWILGCVFYQDPKPEPVPRSAPAPASRPSTKPIDDAQARSALAEFAKASKAKDAKLADRLAAVESLGAGSNKLLVKPLQEVVLKDKALTVRRAAARSLAAQPREVARPAILGLLKSDETQNAPAVTAELVSALAAAGYRSEDWALLGKMFAKEFSAEHIPLQQAILRTVVEHKEKLATKLLIEHLDEPYPQGDIHALENPPAEYWEQRWKAWKVWRADVSDALFALTGQRFASASDAKSWIRHNGKKLGLEDG